MEGNLSSLSKSMEVKLWSIGRLVPYARNPRKNDQAPIFQLTTMPSSVLLIMASLENSTIDASSASGRLDR
jgi:hypothetical protein